MTNGKSAENDNRHDLNMSESGIQCSRSKGRMAHSVMVICIFVRQIMDGRNKQECQFFLLLC